MVASRSPIQTPVSTRGRTVHLLDPREIDEALAPLARAGFEEIEACFRRQRDSHHELTSPERADFILAPIQAGGYGPALEKLRHSRFYKRHRAKVVVYAPDDCQFPALPGLYASAGRAWQSQAWTASAHYLSSHMHKFEFRPEDLQKKDIAFSFVGSTKTAPVRQRIMQLRHPSAYLYDSAGPKDVHWWVRPNAQEFVERYRDVLGRSRFSICPRGFSPSSIRLFESMEAASVPIIVSDDLVLPEGPDWRAFSVVVRESDVDEIPAIVEPLEPRAAEMGRRARAAWEAFFSLDSSANSLVRWATDLLERRRGRSLERDARVVRLREYSSWPLFKAKVRWRITALRSRGRTVQG